MGCLSFTTKRLGGIDLSASRIGGIGLGTERLCGIRFFTSLICDTGIGSYLRVTPVEMQWIDIDLSVDYNVITNKAWNVS